MSDTPTEAFGPYFVYEQLGIGGMAQVHRAEVAATEGFNRPVALKRMLPHVAGNDGMVEAFIREARLASHLRHRNVAQTYELGKVDTIYFIAMELVAGHTLREVLRQCGATTGPMPVPIALNILNQLCDALDYAHNLCDDTGQPLGIIHRDVSPSNIIVAEGGVVKLIDFGIAKASAAGLQTMSGTIKGKFGYMAPEYIAGSIDARADLFAIGVIAHELLTNRPLFTGPDDMGTLQRVRSMAIDPPSRRNAQVPPEIDDIVMTALARDPERRWQQATALRSALTTVTRRLGLLAHDSQVTQWLDWAFTQTTPRRPAASSPPETPVPAAYGGDPSIQIESMTDVDQLPLHSHQKITLMMDSSMRRNAFDPGGPARTPLGTAPPPSLAHPEYRAAVEAYSRRDALVSSGSVMADDTRRDPARFASGPASGPANRQARGQASGLVESPPRVRPVAVGPGTTLAGPGAAVPARLTDPRTAAAVAAAPGTRGVPAVVWVLLAAAVAAAGVYFALPLLS